MPRKKHVRHDDLRAPAHTWVPLEENVVRIEGRLTEAQRKKIAEVIHSEPGRTVIFKPAPAARKPVLLFPAGGISFHSEFVQLRGKPRQILQLLTFLGGQASMEKILSWVWDRQIVTQDCVRVHIGKVRKALRALLQKCGLDSVSDPLPNVDSGDKQTAWELKLPTEKKK
jgi:hypothetical protein